MNCFINELRSLMIKHNIHSLNFTANFDNESKLHIENYDTIKLDTSIANNIIHTPTQDELVDLFRQ